MPSRQDIESAFEQAMPYTMAFIAFLMIIFVPLSISTYTTINTKGIHCTQAISQKIISILIQMFPFSILLLLVFGLGRVSNFSVESKIA